MEGESTKNLIAGTNLELCPCPLCPSVPALKLDKVYLPTILLSMFTPAEDSWIISPNKWPGKDTFLIQGNGQATSTCVCNRLPLTPKRSFKPDAKARMTDGPLEC